jgi:hypothetical protein
MPSLKNIRNRRLRNKDSGEVSIETILMMPVVILIIFAVLQISVAWFGKANLEGAASDVLSAYQEANSPEVMDPSAVSVAQTSMNRHAKFVRRLRVTGPVTASSADRVSFTVVGEVAGAFPGMTFTLSATATGPKELFRPQGDSSP